MKFGKVWCLCELHYVVVSNNVNVDAHVSSFDTLGMFEWINVLFVMEYRVLVSLHLADA